MLRKVFFKIRMRIENEDENEMGVYVDLPQIRSRCFCYLIVII